MSSRAPQLIVGREKVQDFPPSALARGPLRIVDSCGCTVMVRRLPGGAFAVRLRSGRHSIEVGISTEQKAFLFDAPLDEALA